MKRSMTLGELLESAGLTDGLMGADVDVAPERTYDIPVKEVVRYVSTSDKSVPLLERFRKEALTDLVLMLAGIARMKQADEEEFQELLELEEMDQDFGSWG